MILESGTTLVAALQAAVAANNVLVSASYADHSRANAQFLPGAQYAQISGTARASLVSMPSSGTLRQVHDVTIYNADTSTATIFIHKLLSDVSYTIAAQGMLPGESLHYRQGRGWYSRNSGGGDEIYTNFISVSTNNVTGVWTSGISTNNAQGLGSTWTISRISSALSILATEVWSSGFSAKASIASLSYTSSSRTGMAVEFWSSGFSAKASICSNSYTSSSRSVMGVGLWGSGLSIGNATAGGTLITAFSSHSSRVAAFVVNGSSSSFTRIAWTGVQPGDIIITGILPDAAQSSLSSGLVLHSHCTVANFIEMRLSNVSTLVQNQSIKTYLFVRVSPY
jgi:hypothetical protein